MDSLDHDLLTGETLDVGDKVTRRLSQEQATLPHPAAKSSGPIQSKQEIAAEAVKKWEAVHMRVAFLMTSYRSSSVKSLSASWDYCGKIQLGRPSEKMRASGYASSTVSVATT